MPDQREVPEQSVFPLQRIPRSQARDRGHRRRRNDSTNTWDTFHPAMMRANRPPRKMKPHSDGKSNL
jgi:hypothetical protein